MKRLVLIRHAKSSWKMAHAMRDIHRPLNKRGKRDAPEMAQRLKAKGIIPSLLLCSNANRTVSTAKLMAPVLDYAIENIVLTPALYHPDVSAIEEAIHGLSNELQTVFIYIHNPGINDFAETYIPGFYQNIPTCGMIAFDLPEGDWDSFSPQTAKFLFFDFPKNK